MYVYCTTFLVRSFASAHPSYLDQFSLEFEPRMHGRGWRPHTTKIKHNFDPVCNRQDRNSLNFCCGVSGRRPATLPPSPSLTPPHPAHPPVSPACLSARTPPHPAAPFPRIFPCTRPPTSHPGSQPPCHAASLRGTREARLVEHGWSGVRQLVSR